MPVTTRSEPVSLAEPVITAAGSPISSLSGHPWAYLLNSWRCRWTLRSSVTAGARSVRSHWSIPRRVFVDGIGTRGRYTVSICTSAPVRSASACAAWIADADDDVPSVPTRMRHGHPRRGAASTFGSVLAPLSDRGSECTGAARAIRSRVIIRHPPSVFVELRIGIEHVRARVEPVVRRGSRDVERAHHADEAIALRDEDAVNRVAPHEVRRRFGLIVWRQRAQWRVRHHLAHVVPFECVPLRRAAVGEPLGDVRARVYPPVGEVRARRLGLGFDFIGHRWLRQLDPLVARLAL